MERPIFDHTGFIETARLLAAEAGPGAVTVDSVTQRMKVPKGSFYHRFASRDALLGLLWLNMVLAYQRPCLLALRRQRAAHRSLTAGPIGHSTC